MTYPIIDLHCDLMSYLQNTPDASPFNTAEIGCSIPAMEEGHVKLQVMAIFAATQEGSVANGLAQSEVFKETLTKYKDDLCLIKDLDVLKLLAKNEKTGVVAAIENASVFCEEKGALDDGFKNLEQIIKNAQRILYIGLTHHAENRFGGGNYATAGLKEDGKALLKYISGRKIAVDFSHTSDALAHDILECMTKYGLDIPVIASHSNYRPVFNHLRNLPDAIAKEIIARKGLIGVNLLRAFVNNEDPNAIYDHIQHGLELGGEQSICFGADYFYTLSNPDQSRIPFYHIGHEDARCYPSIIQKIEEQFSTDLAKKISHQNAQAFIQRLWE